MLQKRRSESAPTVPKSPTGVTSIEEISGYDIDRSFIRLGHAMNVGRFWP